MLMLTLYSFFINKTDYSSLIICSRLLETASIKKRYPRTQAPNQFQIAEIILKLMQRLYTIRFQL